MKAPKYKKVLVTGADGFIGSHLVEKLTESDFHVRALVHYNSKGSWGLLEDIPNIRKRKNLEVSLGDINDPYFCFKLMQDIELVFHLAALIAIPYSYVAPESFFQTNVLGTVNLLESAKFTRVKRFLHVSTSEVYGSAKYSPINEIHPLQPQSPYSASKIGAEGAALSYFLSFDLPVTIVRPFNNFGPRQSARAVIPTIVSELISPEVKELKLGLLKPIRDYIFVKDTVDALITIAQCQSAVGEVLNIGLGKGRTIEEIFYLISKLLGIKKKVILDKNRLRPAKSEVWELICDNTKLKKMTNWKPKTDFETGLLETIAWVKNNSESYKPDIYNI